ncbi:unnamed protein product [Medioppia subpectinata]|uniref:C-type lectin domain-containing protein n=1 Tax=Medioppia subpectinata TaxID=1979941 RepID=A0A7R9KU65_9ACAR|nr:unnamed protein product [Medioppia subpectinata]CAG2108777.1 unnamed protein product [Medioppia subpectinata]
MDNKLSPVMNTNIKVFDTSQLTRDDLRLIIHANDDNLLQELGEESSGDFEPFVKPKARDLLVAKERTLDKHDDKITERDWVHYKFEKSYLFINRTATKHEAEELCHTLDGQRRDESVTLAVPSTPDEQRFINDYLFAIKHVMKNVWIKQNPYNYAKALANRTSTRSSRRVYRPYANWAEGRPTLTKPCAQIRSPYTVFGDSDGRIGAKWEDVSCFRRNVVLCERAQQWSQQQFIRVAQELNRELDWLKNRYVKVPDSIPVGFTYIQLPHQLEPHQIWPRFKWTDISHTYAGLFMRVLGGQSAPFGKVQESGAPRLASIKSYGLHGVPAVDTHTEEVGADNQWSNGHYNGFPIAFKVTKSEVRPKNIAIKVWKRIK